MSGGVKILIGVGGVVLVGVSLLLGSIFLNAPEVQFVEGDKTTAVSTPKVAEKTTPEVKSESVQQNSPQPTSTTPLAPLPISDEDRATMERVEAELAAQDAKVHETFCESLELKYESDVANEDARHSRALSAIDADWLGRGMGYSGGYQAAKDQENALYQANTQALEGQLVADIMSYRCT